MNAQAVAELDTGALNSLDGSWLNPFRYKDWTNNMATREQIHNHLVDMDESALLMDGFEEALIGFSRRINEPLLAVYSWEKMVDVLIERDGMDFDEAAEYIDFNCVGAWVGDKTPIIVMPLSL